MLKATFKPTGERITTYDHDYLGEIPEDAVEITEEEQQLYSQNGGNDYIRDMVTGLPVKKERSKDQIAQQKLAELDTAAQLAYIAGFYSSASGTKMFYDSDKETQTLLDGVYARTKEADWETKVRYPEVAPAGRAPVRARPLAGDTEEKKTVQYLNKEQIKVLIDDLDSHLFAVKSRLWHRQELVKAAYVAGDENAIRAVKW